MDKNLQKYEAFVKTVETGSFTRAAALLHYSQSGISRMIADLEQEWGVTLLERGKAGVVLTGDGALLLPHARALCTEYARLSAEVDALHGLQSGHIRIGTFSSVATHWLPYILRAFSHDYPGIDYELLLGDYCEVEDWLASGRVDCGFVRLPTWPEFTTIFLQRDDLAAVLPADHPLAAGETCPVQALGAEPFILLDKAGNHEVAEALAQCGVAPDVRFTTWDDYAIMAMVECGLGRRRRSRTRCPVRRLFRPRRASSCAIWTGATHRRHPPETRDLTIGRDLCIITTKSLIFCEICPPASGDREESNVTYTVDDTMKKLLGAPEAVAVLERFFPKILKNPALQMTAAMTLRQVAGFAQSGLTADSLAEIDAQLRALPSSDG